MSHRAAIARSIWNASTSCTTLGAKLSKSLAALYVAGSLCANPVAFIFDKSPTSANKVKMVSSLQKRWPGSSIWCRSLNKAPTWAFSWSNREICGFCAGTLRGDKKIEAWVWLLLQNCIFQGIHENSRIVQTCWNHVETMLKPFNFPTISAVGF